MSYSKQIKKLEKKKKDTQNRYWEKISRKMQMLYFWECRIKGKDMFKMSFEHNGKVRLPDFSKDDEILIEFYASKNGLRIVDERLLRTKSIYSFGKAN